MKSGGCHIQGVKINPKLPSCFESQYFLGLVKRYQGPGLDLKKVWISDAPI